MATQTSHVGAPESLQSKSNVNFSSLENYNNFEKYLERRKKIVELHRVI